MDKLRIGEILLLREALDPRELTLAIQEQPSTRMRLVSLLVSRALIEPDDGALALSEQLDVPGAMQRHLEGRDQSVVSAIPSEVARRWIVLPIGRSRRGSLVVVAKDPTPILAASLQHVTGSPIELAVTPAIQLERLVRSVYGELQPIEEPVAAPAPSPIKAITDLELTEDELRSRSRTVSRLMMPPASGTPELPRRSGSNITKELDGTIQQIERAVNRATAEQHAIALAARLWSAALLVSVGEGALFGRRGHGAKLGSVESIIVPLATPSVLKSAYVSRSATANAPAGPVQQRLAVLLGDAVGPSAAPIIVAGRVEAVLAVGDPLSSEIQAPLTKLATLAEALGAAYERLPR